MRKIHGDAKVICKSVIVSILLSVIITAIVTLIVTIGVCSCCNKIEAHSFSSEDDPRFRKIYEGAGYDVYIDSETNVEYWFWSGAHYAELVPLLDKDGKPLIYKGE